MWRVRDGASVAPGSRATIMDKCAGCGALVPSGNATLHALRCGLATQRAPGTSASPRMASNNKRKVPDGAVIVDVVSDSDDEESYARGHQQALSSDAHLARRLQEEENEADGVDRKDEDDDEDEYERRRCCFIQPSSEHTNRGYEM